MVSSRDTRSRQNFCTLLQYSVLFVCNCGRVDVVYFDLSKGVDKVNHALLLHKFWTKRASLVILKGLESYLSDRHSVVRILNNLSYPFCRLLGAPESFSLGSLLFLIFINELSTYVVNSNNIKLSLSIRSIDDFDFQKDTSQILNWCGKIA